MPRLHVVCNRGIFLYYCL